MFTIVILSFYSKHLIEKLVEKIDKKIPIIIIENSRDEDFKNEIEFKYKNVRVLIPKENLGFSKGMNLGIQEAKTNYVFLNPADVLLPKKCLDDLTECIEKFQDSNKSEKQIVYIPQKERKVSH